MCESMRRFRAPETCSRLLLPEGAVAAMALCFAPASNRRVNRSISFCLL